MSLWERLEGSGSYKTAGLAFDSDIGKEIAWNVVTFQEMQKKKSAGMNENKECSDHTLKWICEPHTNGKQQGRTAGVAEGVGVITYPDLPLLHSCSPVSTLHTHHHSNALALAQDAP